MLQLQKIIIVILIIGLTSCSTKNNEIIIRGKFHGKVPDKIEYTVPINGTWFYGAKKSVTPDSLGNFTISMKSDLTSFVTLYVPRETSAVMLVEPGEKYELEFYLNTKEEKVKIKGANSEALTLYNSFALPEFHVLTTSNVLLKDSVLTSISSKINNLKEKELSQFQKQLKKKLITKDFYDLTELDRNYYYAALEGAIASNRYKSVNEGTKNAETVQFWKKVFEQTLSTKSFNIRSPWSYPLIQNYIQFNQYISESFNIDKIRKIYEQGKIHSFNISESKKYLKGEVLEYYYANYILSNSFQNKNNSKELITLFDMFKKEYPNSNYSEYLKTMIKPIIAFHKKLEETQINDKVQFVENHKDIDSFEKLIKTLNGQKVYVDIWGTWCAPCKKEFMQKDKYAELLKSNNITTLYICEGRVSKEKVWKEMIQFYDLEGQHVLANKNLIADIISRFGNKGSFAYPRYLLVDEKGNVVNAQASYPSKTSKLEKEIKENYVW